MSSLLRWWLLTPREILGISNKMTTNRTKMIPTSMRSQEMTEIGITKTRMDTREVEAEIGEKEVEDSARTIGKVGTGTSNMVEMTEVVEVATKGNRATTMTGEITIPTDNNIRMGSKMLMDMVEIDQDRELEKALTNLRLIITRITGCIMRKILNSSSE